MQRFTLLLIAIALTLPSCNDTVEKRRNIICLIDFSGTIKPETLDNYARLISQDLLINMGKHDKLIVLPIDEGAKTNPVYLTYLDLSEQNFENSNDGLTHKSELERKRIHAFLQTKSDSLYHHLIEQKDVRKKFTNYTDIINAIGQISTKLETNKALSSGEEIWNGIVGETTLDIENILVICSDMIHESKEINFTRAPKTELTDYLTELKNTNRIPDLSRITVFVNGRTGVNNEVVENIEVFWKDYFHEANSTLQSYEFDSHNAIIEYLK